ncbi:MAG: ammonium transporter [Myxococcota bacterium]
MPSPRRALSVLAASVLPWCFASSAAAEGTVDTGDTAWILTATALVLFMTIPGLSLFYGGLVRTKNVLSVLMQCFVLTALMTLLWLAYGYSMAFDTTGMQEGVTNLNSFVGGFGKAFLSGVGPDSVSGTIPELLFFAFQMTFAIITPALIVGAFAERMKFSAMLLFMVGWLTFVYLPICHMTWGGAGGFFADWGVFDFAGGIVVHITAGVAALVLAVLLGTRRGWPTAPMMPHNLTLTVVGTGMLWVGWYGFNAGSALGAGGSAAMALVVTQISASTAALTWMGVEWATRGKPSVLGIVTGSIAGLAAITPASGFVGPIGALSIGLASGLACYWASVILKFKLGYDDSLDVFGVHGVGGFVGTILVAVFASETFGGLEGDLAIGSQLGVQFGAAVITVVYTAIASFVLAKIVDAVVGLRIDDHSEEQGLDLSQHGESGYNL